MNTTFLPTVAVAGATGLVGRKMIEILEERNFPLASLRLLASAGLGWAGLSFLLAWGWAIFHILIVALQAYVFMMLTIVYLSMAHEHH